MTALALAVGLHLLAWVVLVATAYVAGRWLCWELPMEGPLERWAVCGALGLAALADVCCVLGLLGDLAVAPVAVMVAAVHLLGRRAWRELAIDLRDIWRRGSRARSAAVGVGVLAAIATGAPLFLLALYPPTAFDATLYHLPYARAFAESGHLHFLPNLRFPVFPQLSEVLFAAALLLAGEVGPHLVELTAALFTAALLAAWGRRRVSAAAGLLAAAVWLGNPIVIHLSGTAYVEMGLALFGTAALYAGWRWWQSGSRGWLALAGAFAGSAAAVKYLGLYFLGVLALAVLAARVLEGAGRRPMSQLGSSGSMKEAARRQAGDLLVFAGCTAVALAPWYGRIFLLTGNPVFPFLAPLFGASTWQPQDLGQGTPGLGERLGRLATLPWDVLFRRDAVNRQPPFSPAYLAAAPLLALAAWRDRRVRGPLLLALAYVALFPLLPPDARYLVPALPLLSLALGLALAPFLEGIASRLPSGPGSIRRRATALIAAGALALFLPGWLYAGWRIARQGVLPATPAERERYLAARLPLYPAIAHLNDLHRQHGPEMTAVGGYCVYGFYAENMNYFADGVLLGDWNGPLAFQRLVPELAAPEVLAGELRTAGADYLLLPRGLADPRITLPDTEGTRRLFRLEYEDPQARIYRVLPQPDG